MKDVTTSDGGDRADPDRDLEYDLAHDAPSSADDWRAEQGAPSALPVVVATQTEDGGGDYGYDLAHDVPRG